MVVREDNLPPFQWRLGRVVAVHPGKDGIIRSTAVRVGSGIVDRSEAIAFLVRTLKCATAENN